MSTLDRGLSTGSNNGFGRIKVPSSLQPCSSLSYVDWLRKRASESSVKSSPLPIPQSSNDDSTADDEVDSTSECADSEYSIPPAKMPVFSSALEEDPEEKVKETKEEISPFKEISLIKSFSTIVENKCRDIHSEVQKLQKKIACLEKEKRVWKLRKRTLESDLQEEKENSTTAREKQQNAERSLQAEQEYAKKLERKLQDAENQLQNERVVSNQWKQKFQHFLQNFQSELDEAYRQENVPESIVWFSGHDISALPKISMNAIITFLQELTSIWEQLGVALGVEPQVDIALATSTTPDRKCMHVLKFWMSHSPASWSTFLDALTKLKKRRLAIQIEQHLLNKKK